MDKARIARILGFYLIAIASILFCKWYPPFRSGPCTPNLDAFCPFIFLAVPPIPIVINAIKVVMGREEDSIPLILHFFGFVALYVYIFH